jgi:hypothetical protein
MVFDVNFCEGIHRRALQKSIQSMVTFHIDPHFSLLISQSVLVLFCPVRCHSFSMEDTIVNKELCDVLLHPERSRCGRKFLQLLEQKHDALQRLKDELQGFGMNINAPVASLCRPVTQQEFISLMHAFCESADLPKPSSDSVRQAVTALRRKLPDLGLPGRWTRNVRICAAAVAELIVSLLYAKLYCHRAHLLPQLAEVVKEEDVSVYHLPWLCHAGRLWLHRPDAQAVLGLEDAEFEKLVENVLGHNQSESESLCGDTDSSESLDDDECGPTTWSVSEYLAGPNLCQLAVRRMDNALAISTPCAPSRAAIEDCFRAASVQRSVKSLSVCPSNVQTTPMLVNVADDAGIVADDLVTTISGQPLQMLRLFSIDGSRGMIPVHPATSRTTLVSLELFVDMLTGHPV